MAKGKYTLDMTNAETQDSARLIFETSYNTSVSLGELKQKKIDLQAQMDALQVQMDSVDADMTLAATVVAHLPEQAVLEDNR